jgi:hypothetical protein
MIDLLHEDQCLPPPSLQFTISPLIPENLHLLECFGEKDKTNSGAVALMADSHSQNIDTDGGAYIEGDVTTKGDFVGRDKVINETHINIDFGTIREVLNTSSKRSLFIKISLVIGISCAVGVVTIGIWLVTIVQYTVNYISDVILPITIDITLSMILAIYFIILAGFARRLTREGIANWKQALLSANNSADSLSTENTKIAAIGLAQWLTGWIFLLICISLFFDFLLFEGEASFYIVALIPDWIGSLLQ